MYLLDEIAPACIHPCSHAEPFAVNQPFQDTQGRVEPTIGFGFRLKDDTEQAVCLAPPRRPFDPGV